MKQIAIIDPASYTLPYDFFYINEVSKYYKIDFYYSSTKYNYEYIEQLKNNKNITLKEYDISSSVVYKIKGLINYLKMLFDIQSKKKQYQKIHFMWNLFLPIEKFFFKLYGNKLIFTFHNNVPHSFNGNIFKPYEEINKLASKKIFVSSFTKDKFLDNYDSIGQYFLLNHGIMPLNDLEEANQDIDNDIDNCFYFWGRVEEYKGIDIFREKLHNYEIKIFGKWNQNLNKLKNDLINKENIEIVDEYLSTIELARLLKDNNIFILPYKDATQSGVLYTLLAYEKVFISSDVGENSKFLIENGLKQLVFNRDDEGSIVKSFEFAKNNYNLIKEKLKILKKDYQWNNIMTEKKIKEIYE